MIVLDASVAVGWLLGENLPVAGFDAILTTRRIVVPAHWIVEIGNATVKALHRNRIAEERLVVIEEELSRLAISIEPPITLNEALPLLRFARLYGLSMYDAIYIHTALSHQAELATFDGAMRNASLRLGIPLWPS